MPRDQNFTNWLIECANNGTIVRIIKSRGEYEPPPQVQTHYFDVTGFSLHANMMIIDKRRLMLFSSILDPQERGNSIFRNDITTLNKNSTGLEQDHIALFELLWNTPSNGNFDIIRQQYVGELGFVLYHKMKTAKLYYLLQPNSLYAVNRPNMSTEIDKALSDPASDKIVITESFFPESESLDFHRLASQWAGYFEYSYTMGDAEEERYSTIIVNAKAFERHRNIYCSMIRARNISAQSLETASSPVLITDTHFRSTLIYTSMAALLFQGSVTDTFNMSKVIAGVTYQKPAPFSGSIFEYYNTVKSTSRLPDC